MQPYTESPSELAQLAMDSTSEFPPEENFVRLNGRLVHIPKDSDEGCLSSFFKCLFEPSGNPEVEARIQRLIYAKF